MLTWAAIDATLNYLKDTKDRDDADQFPGSASEEKLVQQSISTASDSDVDSDDEGTEKTYVTSDNGD